MRTSALFRRAMAISPTVALLLALLSPWAAPAHADRWVVECIDCSKYFLEMTDRSLRLDAQGHPHIAYGGEHLYYTWHDGVRWHHEMADDSPKVGQYASLALDGNGFPHISYLDFENWHLKYAYKDADGWHVETADNAWHVGWFTSLALDHEDKPHISYVGASVLLRYAYRNAEGWHVEYVGEQVEVDGTSLAVDHAGKPHILFNDADHDELKHAQQENGDWIITTIDDPTDTGDSLSLALDSAGQPHASYRDESLDGSSAKSLKYAYRNTSGWHTMTIESGDEGWWENPSLSLDNLGFAHISFTFHDSAGSAQELRYARRLVAGWQVETVGSGKVLHTSLALDAANRPHITYQAGSDLAYTQQGGLGWVPEVVDRGRDVDGNISLVLDEADSLHASYTDSLGDSVHYAYRDAGGWHTMVVTTTWLARSNSLVLAADGYPHISYQVGERGDNTVRYIYQDNGTWHGEIIDGTIVSTGSRSLALDEHGYAHLSYGTNPCLKQAYQDASGWHIENADCASTASPSFHSSLVLDQDGYQHIAHCFHPGPLRYTYRDSSGWHSETVSTAVDVTYDGCHSSLALDEDGVPHISYNTGWQSPTQLRYAYRDAEGWQDGVVDSTGKGVGDTSLVIDSDGWPHIGYYDGESHSVKYAYKDAAGWHTEVVDSKGGEYVSLVLDTAGMPHIGYYDEFNRDLKHAYRIKADYSTFLALVHKSATGAEVGLTVR